MFWNDKPEGFARVWFRSRVINDVSLPGSGFESMVPDAAVIM